jgi:DNA-binding transcriptional regulator YiaG
MDKSIGAKQPTGAALALLNVIERKGDRSYSLMAAI